MSTRKQKTQKAEDRLILIGSFIVVILAISIPAISIPLVVIWIAQSLFFKSSYGKGWLGEYKVKTIIGFSKPNKDYYVINNLTFNDGDKSAQIDHLIIDRSGIIVIETKNRSGKIYGNESDLNWTIVYKFGKEKATFLNPIKQNDGHIKSLKKVFSREIPMHSIIVFTNNADIREVHSQKVPVVYSNSIKNFMKDYQYDQTKLSSEDVRKIHDQLLLMKQNNKITNKEHVASINNRILQRKNKKKELK
jgi:hypothetical protein